MASEDTDYSLLVESLYRHARLTQFLLSEDASLPEELDNAVVFRNPERLPYEESDEGVLIHVAQAREYLWDIAQQNWGKYVPNAFELWEVLAQFQPEPVIDPSVPLTPGREILVPPMTYVETVAFGDTLREVPEL